MSSKVTTFTNVVNVEFEQQITAEIEAIEKSLQQTQNNRKQLMDDLIRERGIKWVKCFDNIAKMPTPEVVTWEESIDEKGFKIDRSSSLGTGKFSNIYQAKWREKSKEVSCKILQFKQFQASLGIKDWERHTKILCDLKHPKINAIVKAFTVTSTSKIYLFSIYAPKKSVQHIVEQTKKAIQTDLVRMWTRDVLEALAYLHSIGLAHRKVHPNNVLVKEMACNAKLAAPDAFAELFNPSEPKQPCYSKCHKIIESPYTAYEGLFGHSYDPTPADIWSLGCVTFYMLTKKPPFVYLRKQSQMKDEVNARRWAYTGISDKGPKLSDNQKGFFGEIFVIEAEKRPTAVELLTRPFLQI